MAHTPLVGTTTDACDGTLDGLPARLIRRRTCGSTVALLASRSPLHQADMAHLRPAEFRLHPDATQDLPPDCRRQP